MKNLSFDEIKLVHAIRAEDHSLIQKELVQLGLESLFASAACKKMKAEISAYSAEKNAPLLQNTTPEQLLDFSLRALMVEFRQKVPTLLDVITTVINRGDKRSSRKDAVATTIVAKVLGTYNKRLSAFRYVTGFILELGAAKEKCINRLARSKDTVKPQTLRNKLTEMSKLTPVITKDWDLPRAASAIVFDNVNPYVKPRHQTSEKGNKLYSMCHALMVRDRVPTSHLSSKPAKFMSQLVPDDILPNHTHTDALRTCFVRILRNVWASNVSGLQWMSTEVPRNKYSHYTEKAAQFVSKVANDLFFFISGKSV